MRLGDNSGDGMSRVVVSEDAELRDQADHAKHLCRLTRYIRAIIDGYAAGPHLLPKIHVDPKRLVERDGKEGIKIPAKEDIILFVPSYVKLQEINILFADSTGFFAVKTKTIERPLNFSGYRWTTVDNRSLFFQDTYANGLLQTSMYAYAGSLEEIYNHQPPSSKARVEESIANKVSCWQPFSGLNQATAVHMRVVKTAEGEKELRVFIPPIEGEEETYYEKPLRQPFSVLNQATAACIQVIETAEGKRELQIFTPLIEGEEEEETYDEFVLGSGVDGKKFAALKRKVCVIGLLRPGYVEDLAAVALRVKNERKVIE